LTPGRFGKNSNGKRSCRRSFKLQPKFTNSARIVASQMRMAKLQELTGMFATVNGCSAIVATTVMPHPNIPVLRQLRSILVNRYSD